VQVPSLINMTEADARAAIGDAGLRVGDVGFEASETVDADHVSDQDPPRDEYVDPGASIDITISSGLPDVDVPSLTGSTQEEARTKLRDAHLKPTFMSVDSDLPQGQVLSTTPEGGTAVAQDSTVTVTISKGPKTVPNVVGLNRSDAVAALVGAGFQYEFSGDDRSTEPKGTVTRQIPGAEPKPQGTVVVLFVSTYDPPPTPTETPTETPTTAPPTDLPTTPVTPPAG